MKRILSLLLMVALMLVVPAVQAAVLDTNLTAAADELTTTWGGTMKPLIWSVVLALIGISWIKLLKKR